MPFVNKNSSWITGPGWEKCLRTVEKEHDKFELQ